MTIHCHRAKATSRAVLRRMTQMTTAPAFRLAAAIREVAALPTTLIDSRMQYETEIRFSAFLFQLATQYSQPAFKRYTDLMHHAYILRCADGTLYSGCTTDLKKRLHSHNHLKSAARYTRARRPVLLVHSERFRTLAKARAREAAFKRMKRAEKLALIGKIRVRTS